MKVKQIFCMTLASLILIAALPSCRSGANESESDSVQSDNHTVSEETNQDPSENVPPEEPMESITTFQNPIMTYQTENAWPGYGFGDPFVMRHNGVYYLYVSTKDGSVGIRCWSSYDLVNWKFEGYCANDPLTRGAYAPEVYYYNGYFYMYTSPAGNGHYVLRSTSPTKGFEVVTDNMGMSIDGSVFMDNDGKWYFYTAGHGAMQVYDMTSPTTMKNGRPISSVSVNGGWTEGGMTVYHDGYYYITYTGNHVLSPSYRILYGASNRTPLSFERMEEWNPLLISTAGDVIGIGHSSTVKGPDLDSYYLVYHALLDTTPNRTMNIDRIIFNGKRMEIAGPTTTPQQAPQLPDVYHRFEPGSSLGGWSLTGSLSPGGSGLHLAPNSMLVSKTDFTGDFTAEFNITSIADGGQAGAIFAYSDAKNFGACYFSPLDQKVIIEITVDGNTSVTELDTVRSFGENTRFDCLQSIQIERNGKDYTFYMNDHLLCRIDGSSLTGGAIGYATRGSSATFGFIGGTGAVGGRGAADLYKTVSSHGGYIPAFEALEAYDETVREDGLRAVTVGEGDSLTFQILAADKGTYDLSFLYHTVDSDEVHVSIYADGQAVDQLSVGGTEPCTMTAVLRGMELSEGQHRIALRVEKGKLQIEHLTISLHVPVTEQGADSPLENTDPVYLDGDWVEKNGVLSLSGTRSFGKILYGSQNWGDYEVEVTVTPKDSPNCGLLVRAVHPGNPAFLGSRPTREDAAIGTDWLEGYFVGLTPTGVILGKQSYGYRSLAHGDGQFNARQSYRLKVICEGARIRVFVDGKLYLDYTDPLPFLQGMVGVRTHDCSASFDGLTVKPVSET